MNKIRWGILGPGVIANKFVTGLKSLPDAEIIAVASRNIDRAKEFGEKYSIPKCYGSYDQMINDNRVDVIYISTPHYSHKDLLLKCLNGGKAVLCEKPMAVNSKDMEEILKTAVNKKLFVMEAMWTRFLPVIKKVNEYILSGTIGAIRMVKADFCFSIPFDPEHRLFNPKLGGGALLDVGIYPIALAQMIFKEKPISILGEAFLGKTGVDEQACMLLKYSDGQLAQLSCAVSTDYPKDALIIGESGYIKIDNFWMGEHAKVYKNGELIEEIDLPVIENGYEYEAIEVMNCIREGKLQSDSMTLQNSKEIVYIMDTLRQQWGLKYPFED